MVSLFFFSTFFFSDLHIGWTFPLPLYQWWKNPPESIASKRIKGSWELAHHTCMLWFYERSFIEGFFLFAVARFFCLGGKGTGNLIFVTPLDSPRQRVFFRSHWKDLKITKESTKAVQRTNVTAHYGNPAQGFSREATTTSICSRIEHQSPTFISSFLLY